MAFLFHLELLLYVGANHLDAEYGCDFVAVGGFEFHASSAQDNGSGGAYYSRRLRDSFLQHLQSVWSVNHNQAAANDS